ncbi:YcaO-like family protein [Kitasatospora sp. NPDC096077]|uniref:YcaO-like family protein n=1 Tax=Kitasatospora sp. NPDC096077 TaxID=3155544 RepID=UPI0033185A53
MSESLGAEHWMAGRGIVSGAEYLVPAQAVLLGWDPPAEKRWWVQTSVGTAAHPDPDAASRAALAEVLERDALVRGWRTGEIEFHDLGWLLAEALPASLYNKIVTDNVTISVVRAGSTAFHPVLAMMHRRDGGNLTCGAAIRADTRAAVRHAVLEALLVRVSLSAPAQPGRLEAHHHTRGLLAAQNGPQHLRFIAERSNGPDTAVATETTLPALSVHARERFGHEPVVVDLPAAAGHAVRRVICPGSSVLEPRGAETGLLSPIA